MEIKVPTIGEGELPIESLTGLRLAEILGGTLLPTQGFVKAMARYILLHKGLDSLTGQPNQPPAA